MHANSLVYDMRLFPAEVQSNVTEVGEPRLVGVVESGFFQECLLKIKD